MTIRAFNHPAQISQKLGLPESDLAGVGRIENFPSTAWERLQGARSLDNSFDLYVQPTKLGEEPAVEVMTRDIMCRITATTSTKEFVSSHRPHLKVTLDENFLPSHFAMLQFPGRLHNKTVPRVIIKPDENDDLAAYVYDGGNNTSDQGRENFASGPGNQCEFLLQAAKVQGWQVVDYRAGVPKC